MRTIEVTVDGIELSVVKTQELIAGSVNDVGCRFAFSPDWDGLVRVAVFTGGESSIAVMLESDTVPLPYETLARECAVYTVGVYGYEGTVLVRQTSPAAIGYVKRGCNMSADNAAEPSPELIQQALAAAAAAQKQASILKDDGDGSAFLADDGIYKDVNTFVRHGKDGITPHIGENGCWWIGESDTGIPAKFSGSAADAAFDPTESGLPAENAQQAIDALDKSTRITAGITARHIAINDSADRAFDDLRLYGRSSQDGTPTPDSPIDIVCTGGSGNVTLGVYGGNLLKYPYAETTHETCGITFTDMGDGNISASGTATATAYFRCASDTVTTPLLAVGASYRLTGCPQGGGTDTYRLYAQPANSSGEIRDSGEGVTFESTQQEYKVIIRINSGVTVSNLIFRPRLALSSMTSDDSSYSAQTLTISADYGLHGLLTSHSGNYTDPEQRQYKCDVLDLGSGIIKRRLKFIDCAQEELTVSRHSFSNDDYFVAAVDAPTADISPRICISSHFSNTATTSQLGTATCVYLSSSQTSPLVISLPTSLANDADSLKLWLKQNGVTFVYPLAEPIEAELSPAEREGFAALRANLASTTLLNNSGADMTVSYTADHKHYIDNKFSALEAAILSLGGNI